MKVKSMHWESQWLANASHDVGFTGFRSTQHTLPCVMQTLKRPEHCSETQHAGTIYQDALHEMSVHNLATA